jgi:5-methylcytosine-specific restriction endonuclease McrA
MSVASPLRKTRGRSVIQYELTRSGEIGRRIAEYPTITAASSASGVSYHIIRGILDGKAPKPGQYHWKESVSSNHTGHFPSHSDTVGVVSPSPPPIPPPPARSLLMTLQHSNTNVYPAPLQTNRPIVNTVVHTRSASSGEKPKKKDTIPSLMRTQVWNRWIGIEKGQIRCPYCHINYITPFSFECGHVLAEAKGGEVSIENLRPLCSECNRKMSTQPIDLNRYRLLPGVAGQINPQNKQPYPTTVDGQRAFIEAHTLTNLHGKVGEALRALKYEETMILAKTRWRNWVEVYEMCAPQPVLVTDKTMHLHPYNEQLAAKMKVDSCRSSLSKVFQKLGI